MGCDQGAKVILDNRSYSPNQMISLIFGSSKWQRNIVQGCARTIDTCEFKLGAVL